jgi:hypothetical protein
MSQLALSGQELTDLVQAVFAPGPNDTSLFFLVDLPRPGEDDPEWLDRRLLAKEWYQILMANRDQLKLSRVRLFYYANVGSNNRDFPQDFFESEADPRHLNAEDVALTGKPIGLKALLEEASIIIALTKFSATAPLKILAPNYHFRAATMPGFNRRMIPSLRLPMTEVNRKVMEIKKRLDRASGCELEFSVKGVAHSLYLDLRERSGHASGGVFHQNGVAGNLPSGEAYIVPYEGEKGFNSQSRGILPVQFQDEVVLYRIEQNQASEVLSQGHYSEVEKGKLVAEPAYGNIAELGFGVLAGFGVEPIGEILLDEKLGLHIAFGRSDHFGGITSPAKFHKPENVIHIDRIFLKSIQDQIEVVSVTLLYPAGERELFMEAGKYVYPGA